VLFHVLPPPLLDGIAHCVQEPSVPEPPIDKEFLKGYVSYARKVCHPRINDAAVRDLIKGYMDMRRMGMSAKTITATPRQLESLIRLSEALAKMRLSNWVVQNDVAEAIRLMRVSTQTAATDPRTGTIDLDMINTGHTITERDSMTVLASAVRDLLTEHAKTGSRRMTLPELRRRVQAQSDVDVDMDEIRGAVQQLDGDGFLQFNVRAQSLRVIRAS
jgi:DNA replication licensing factor MCM4